MTEKIKSRPHQLRARRPAALAVLAMGAALLVGQSRPALAEEAAASVNAFVDRLSTRIDAAIFAPVENEHFRELPAADAGDRLTIKQVLFGGCDGEQLCKLKTTVAQAGKGPRLLLVDAGAIFRGPAGADFVAVPNQRFVVEQSQVVLDLEALPVWPNRPAPPEATPLKVVGTNDPGLIAVLRSVQRFESEDVNRLRRYVKDTGGTLAVDTAVSNEDVKAAHWMSWYKDPVGQIQGRYPRDAVRLAIFAVTAGYTINEAADWFRTYKQLDMNPAIAAAGEAARRIEMLLERAGLNFRVFSPAHADYHLNRGIRSFRAGDLDAAEKSFRTAISKNSELHEAHHNLGITLYRKGKYEDAEAALQIGIGVEDAKAETFYNRAATLYRMGDKLGAARMLRKVIELNPRDPDAESWLAKADPENKTVTKKAPEKPVKKGKK